MESQALTKRLQSQCEPPQLTLADLIDEWLPKLAVNAGAALDAATQAVYRSIWLEGLADLSPAVVLAAFRKTLRECAFWPVKVADIRKHVTNTESKAATEAADLAWQHVLDLRRLHYNPDMPHVLARELERLPERIRQAARASGIFREFTATEFQSGAMHTWAKKRFLDSFAAYGDLQNQFLLPDGEIKNLLAGFAQAKALPAPTVSFEDLHERGLEYGATVRGRMAWEEAKNASEWEPGEYESVVGELGDYGKRFENALARNEST